MRIFPLIVTAKEIVGTLSRSGLPRSFRRSTLSAGASPVAPDRGTTSAGGELATSAAAFAARSSGVPFFDRRGFGNGHGGRRHGEI